MNRVECPAFGNFRGQQKLDCLLRLYWTAKKI
jgi:hypothetical protein